MIGLRCLLVPVLFSVVLTPRAFGQGSTLNVTIEGLAQDDQATLTAERGVGGLYDAVMTGAGESTPVTHTFSLDSGPWVLSIDAPGYMTPLAETIDVDGGGECHLGCRVVGWRQHDLYVYLGGRWKFLPGMLRSLFRLIHR